MNLRTLAMMLALGVSAGAAPVPKELKRPDIERFQGDWTCENFDRGGRNNIGLRFAFKGDTTRIVRRGATDEDEIERFVLRPEKRPAEIDFLTPRVDNCSGIYKFVGDELHIAFYDAALRPTDFASVPDKYVLVLKRVPEGKK